MEKHLSCEKTATVSNENEKEVDIWRDTPVRLLGYANEVGESFRAQVHVNWVRLSYAIAFGYVLADTSHKTNAVTDKNRKLIVAADTLCWQMLASVAIPGFTINRICALSLFLLKHKSKLGPQARKWCTTAIGLSSIPFIVKPIDKLVDHIMDSTFRVYFKEQ